MTEKKQGQEIQKTETAIEQQKGESIIHEKPKRLTKVTVPRLTKALGESDANTVKLIFRIASNEGRKDDVGGLLNDMIQCYVKRYHPSWDMEFEQSPPGLRREGEEPIPDERGADAAAGGIFARR